MSSNAQVTSPPIFVAVKTCTVTNGGNISLDYGTAQLAPSKEVTIGKSGVATEFRVRGTLVATVFNNSADGTVTTTAGARIPGVGPIEVAIVMENET